MISIVMSYYNRKKLLYNTLQSIKESAYTDYEVILVDDYSYPEHRVEDLVAEFPFMRVIRIEKEDKWYLNTCIPYNRGIAEAKGDVIVLQNPECIHIGDVLTYIAENITGKNYLSISTYAYGKSKVNEFSTILSDFKTLPQRKYKRLYGWYNHPEYRPVYLHFCSAITRTNMNLLGGFDERFAMGVAYDDDELVERVTRLGLKMEIPTEVSVLHQYHEPVAAFKDEDKLEKNKCLFEMLTKQETSIYKINSFNKPKVSVIIPYKDDRGWLDKAIESVPDWVELIVSQGDAEVSKNFNDGLRRATGDYIKFLHEDDMLPPYSLERAVQAMIDQKVDIVHGNGLEMDINGKFGHLHRKTAPVTYDTLLRVNPIHGGTVLYRKEVFALIGGFDEEIHYAEEFDFNLRCLWAGFKLGYVDDTLYYYRRHPNTKSVEIRRHGAIVAKSVIQKHLENRDSYARL